MDQKTLRAAILRVIAIAIFILACASSGLAQSAPDFSLKDTGGRQYTLSQFRGKVVLLNFITYLCKPCKEEMPYLNEFDKEFRGQGFQVIGIGLASTAEQLRGMAQQVGVDYPILVGTDAVAKAYGNVEFVPTTFIIDRQGNIAHKLNGPQSKADFVRLIKSVL